MTVAQALEVLKAAGYTPIYARSETPLMTDDDIELGDGVSLQVVLVGRLTRFSPIFWRGEGTDFTMWDNGQHYADPVVAAMVAMDLRAKALAEIGERPCL